MIPGVGLFYSGLARRKSALGLLLLSMLSVAVVGFQWFFWGYSLTFSRTGNAFLGDMSMIGLKDVIAQPNGAVADRGRILPAIVFMFIWTTVVYDPIAYWTWNGNGWLFQLGSLDFAGGGPVHVASGTCALAYSIMLGKRTGYSRTAGMPWRPHNVTNVVIGTVFLWVGWFGFNGGSALGMNIRAIMASYNTQLAACMAALSWILLDYRLEKKWSTIGFCSGAISGLVAIPPAAGFVTPWGALIIGIVGGICCNFATKLKFLIGVDEALDIFAVHGVGGIVGNILTGVFAASWIAKLDGAEWEPLGWIEHHWVQMGYQFAGTVAAFAWSFTLTCLILFLLNLVPGLSLRATPEEEELGMDDVQLGEFAYDYVELTRHLSDTVSVSSAPWPPPARPAAEAATARPRSKAHLGSRRCEWLCYVRQCEVLVFFSVSRTFICVWPSRRWELDVGCKQTNTPHHPLYSVIPPVKGLQFAKKTIWTKTIAVVIYDL